MSMESFFDPKSVAVVGASRTKGKVGHEIVAGLVNGGFPGKIYPVNHKADEVEGLHCYNDLKSIGEVPELVVIVIPPKIVKLVMQQCADIGVKAVVIITAGFREVGDEGRKLEEEILQIARKA